MLEQRITSLHYYYKQHRHTRVSVFSFSSFMLYIAAFPTQAYIILLKWLVHTPSVKPMFETFCNPFLIELLHTNENVLSLEQIDRHGAVFVISMWMPLWWGGGNGCVWIYSSRARRFGQTTSTRDLCYFPGPGHQAIHYRAGKSSQ